MVTSKSYVQGRKAADVLKPQIFEIPLQMVKREII